MTTASTEVHTLADLLERLGGISPARVRFEPPPGTATVNDVIAIERSENRLCELVDGVLVEKVMVIASHSSPCSSAPSCASS